MHKYKDSVCRRRLKREVCRCTWCTAPSTSAVLEIRSTVPPRMSRDSSSFCRILLRLLSRHRPFSVWKHTHTHSCTFSLVVLLRLISDLLCCTAPPKSPSLCSAPAGRSPQPGFGHAPPPAASASGCTDHSWRPGWSERRPSASNKVSLYFTQILNTPLTFQRFWFPVLKRNYISFSCVFLWMMKGN